MKAEIILTIVWMSVCLCERKQRSTVLTDESKRIVEHFDFSNFDKQEALNYLDRQRFENQIRGKRSHTKFKRDPKIVNQNDPTDIKLKQNEPQNPNEDLNEENTEYLNSDTRPEETNQNYLSESSDANYEKQSKPIGITSRNRRGHRLKKKRKYKASSYEESNNDNFDNVEELKFHRKKKKQKKKKKKKKKKRHYWDKWSEWSPCSVTCGRGRRIRWRKCIAKNCTSGEIEMGEKTCQLPACNLLTKLLGL